MAPFSGRITLDTHCLSVILVRLLKYSESTPYIPQSFWTFISRGHSQTPGMTYPEPLFQRSLIYGDAVFNVQYFMDHSKLVIISDGVYLDV